MTGTASRGEGERSVRERVASEVRDVGVVGMGMTVSIDEPGRGAGCVGSSESFVSRQKNLRSALESLRTRKKGRGGPELCFAVDVALVPPLQDVEHPEHVGPSSLRRRSRIRSVRGRGGECGGGVDAVEDRVWRERGRVPPERFGGDPREQHRIL